MQEKKDPMQELLKNTETEHGAKKDIEEDASKHHYILRQAHKASRITGNLPGLYFKVHSNPVDFISEKEVENNNLNELRFLIPYINKKFPYELDLPYEIIFENRILSHLAGTITWSDTSQDSPLKFCLKYIRNPPDDENSTTFFYERGIDTILNIQAVKIFEPCIQDIKDTTYKIRESDVQGLKQSHSLRLLVNEPAIRSLVGRVLEQSLVSVESDVFNIYDAYPIEIKEDNYASLADHAILNLATQRAVLIVEDAFLDLGHAMRENFDQLRAYSFTSAGNSLPFIYGIGTTYNEWVFCCYVLPSTGRDVDAYNFLASKVHYLNIGDDDTPTHDSIENIIQIIRGYLTKKNLNEIIKKRKIFIYA